jgi:membrane protein YdbS with pleckstrin-like domain
VRYAVVSPVIIVIWLLIGALAAGQRGYFQQSSPDCGSLWSTVVTILVGPLNYVGVNPEIECPDLPEPSQ